VQQAKRQQRIMRIVLLLPTRYTSELKQAGFQLLSTFSHLRFLPASHPFDGRESEGCCPVPVGLYSLGLSKRERETTGAHLLMWKWLQRWKILKKKLAVCTTKISSGNSKLQDVSNIPDIRFEKALAMTVEVLFDEICEPVVAHVDTCAEVSCINSELAMQLAMKYGAKIQKMKEITIGGSSGNCTASQAMRLTLRLVLCLVTKNLVPTNVT
jgi:hypothetical protein